MEDLYKSAAKKASETFKEFRIARDLGKKYWQDLEKQFRSEVYTIVKSWALDRGITLTGATLQMCDYRYPYYLTEIGIWISADNKKWSNKVVISGCAEWKAPHTWSCSIRTHKVTTEPKMLHPFQNEFLEFVQELNTLIFPQEEIA